MSDKFTFGETDVRLGGPEEGTPEPDAPFRLLVAGDFTGARARRRPLSARKPFRVDRDTLEDVLARLDVEVEIATGGAPAGVVRLRELDDLHPDRLLQKVDRLRDLVDASERAAPSSA